MTAPNALQRTTDALNRVSPSFCTVKWKHATVNLSTGTSKSCCHQGFRKISRGNLAAGLQLHDTPEDQAERRAMRVGGKPANCDLCWWVESRGQYSDRTHWSAKSWMAPHLESVAGAHTAQAMAPSWVELNFSSICNLRCSYCSPIFSTRWYSECEELGPYPTRVPHNDIRYLEGAAPLASDEKALLQEEFWQWFNQVYAGVSLLKITGGEPLLNANTVSVLEKILAEPNPALTLAINSNLMPSEPTWKRFLELARDLVARGRVKRLYLHPSVDSWGAHAEYIRNGLDFATFWRNVLSYCEETRGHLIFTSTVNNLSIFKFKEFWQNLLELKRRYAAPDREIGMTCEVLIGPAWQNVAILPSDYRHYLDECRDFVAAHVGDSPQQFTPTELMGLEKAISCMAETPAGVDEARRDFARFFREHDRRRGTNLLASIPEIADFYQMCRELEGS